MSGVGIVKILETIRIGCSDGVATPDKSHVIRFCNSTIFAHGTLISQIAPAFVNAQLLCDESISKEPYHVSVIFPFELDKVRKETDVETAYERIKWYFNNLMVPTCGMVVTFYQNLESKSWITAPWHLQHLWPLKERWEPKNRYVTIQRLEPLVGGSAKRNKDSIPEYEDRAINLAKSLGYEVKFIDYLMPFDELLYTMKHSDHHFSYQGSSYFFAGLLGTPTTIWGSERPRTYAWNSYYSYHKAERVHLNHLIGRWGTLGTNQARIMQYDFEVGAVMNRPVSYMYQIDSVGELDNEFKKLSVALPRD
tara:strand:+ start:1380 stop:2303 length:924 start_codon:yes stop_codon:yes gene_type:complete